MLELELAVALETKTILVVKLDDTAPLSNIVVPLLINPISYLPRKA